MTAKIIDDVLNDPTISDWLKWALRSALERDPVDVTNDVEILHLILVQRLEALGLVQYDCVEL